MTMYLLYRPPNENGQSEALGLHCCHDCNDSLPRLVRCQHFNIVRMRVKPSSEHETKYRDALALNIYFVSVWFLDFILLLEQHVLMSYHHIAWHQRQNLDANILRLRHHHGGHDCRISNKSLEIKKQKQNRLGVDR